MFERSLIQCDVASAIALGKRDTQEDAVISDFSIGSKIGIAVLADGMGGHNAGDVASNVVASTMYAELRMRTAAMLADPNSVHAVLWQAMETANERLRNQIAHMPKQQGMGCTLVALVQTGTTAHWISVGDSALYLFRDGTLQRLNDDHSLAPQIDDMAEQGLISEAEARNHPDRSILTSAINGQAIRYVDRRDKGVPLRYGDVLVLASDGLSFLDDAVIVDILEDEGQPTSADKSERLLKAIKERDHPNQDNVSFALVQVSDGEPRRKPILHSIDGGAPSTIGPVDGLRDFARAAPDAPAKTPILRRLKSISAGLIG